MSLADEIAALPEWSPAGYPMCLGEDLRAALARLRLAREWIADVHKPDCEFTLKLRLWPVMKQADCTCCRDALLAALEPPK